MCVDKDLFNDVIVTLDDVALWLDVIPANLSNSPNARLRYCKEYDVASKIKTAKLNGLFYTLENKQKNNSHDFKHAFHPNYELPLNDPTKPKRLAHLLGEY
jgi:hypothetical protein